VWGDMRKKCSKCIGRDKNARSPCELSSHSREEIGEFLFSILGELITMAEQADFSTVRRFLDLAKDDVYPVQKIRERPKGSFTLN